MPKAKKKTLPKNFEELLRIGNSSDAIRAVFDTCDVNARGGSFKRTALAFNELPDEVARWLVANGADISAADNYGETPLHARAGHWQGKINILLELGADVNNSDSRGDTPLHKAASVGNVQTARTGAKRPPDARRCFHRPRAHEGRSADDDEISREAVDAAAGFDEVADPHRLGVVDAGSIVA